MNQIRGTENKKNLVKIQIFGRNYTVGGGNNQEYIEELASYVDEKMNGIAQGTEETRFGDIAALACLNIADEFKQSKNENKNNFEIVRNKIGDLVVKIDNKIGDST